MKLKEKISFEEICGKTYKIRVIETADTGIAAFTHYLSNQNEELNFYKKLAIEHVRHALEYKYPDKRISDSIAESALQLLIFDMKKLAPFSEPDKSTFKFIDLFAGIGGFRLAMQSLGGKCVFTSEWDEQAKKTYHVNFGEVPFGDITKDEIKNCIPDNFDILCAGFPCQAFSIAGRRAGFEDTRGTLFFDVAEILKRKKPKAFLLENVKGLRNHDQGKTLKIILSVLRDDLNYYVPNPQTLNAKDFGVPQNRERIFIVGFRKDLGISDFSYPEPLNNQVCFRDIKETSTVSVKYYLSDRYLNTLKAHKKRHETKGNGFGYEIISDDGIANAVVCGGMGRERNLVYD
ncbi:MAG: DNA cytosine methyltransferase, partial [Candidatus Cloacimonetes bacterium]|nr:DNA cytosine methyltransferase [Candidatus Cloacimonadota bacterium]